MSAINECLDATTVNLLDRNCTGFQRTPTQLAFREFQKKMGNIAKASRNFATTRSWRGFCSPGTAMMFSMDNSLSDIFENIFILAKGCPWV